MIEIKEEEMDGECSTQWEDGEKFEIFWLENLRRSDHSKDRGVDGRIILKCLRETEWEGMN
jgi:hypothetical protein